MHRPETAVRVIFAAGSSTQELQMVTFMSGRAWGATGSAQGGHIMLLAMRAMKPTPVSFQVCWPICPIISLCPTTVPWTRTGTQDLLEGSGLLQGAKGGWDPNKSPVKASASAPGAAKGSSIGRQDRPELHPAMSGGARTLLEGSGLLQSSGASGAKKE